LRGEEDELLCSFCCLSKEREGREREREQWETYTTSQGEDVCGFDVLYMRRGRAHYQTGHTSAHNILAAKMC
jgi:hypothetical protein